MSDNSIAKGLKARANARKANRNNPAPGMGPSYGQGGVMSQYNNWNFGISYGNNLDREWQDFSSGAFGPLLPIQPMGIDAPVTESGRPEPRRMQYPVGWNMPMGQPGSEGLKLVSFANLRAYADMYSVVRAAIQVRKEEILGLDWDIVPTDEAARDMRGDISKHDDFQDRRAKALKFFKRPDPNYHDFSGWLGAVLEDVFVVDALSLYIHPSRVPGKGLLGSDLAALEVLDGTTIRPLLDVRGGTPRPPAPGYQQYLWGVPRTDLMDIILEADIEEMDEPVADYRADQLLYLPYTRRSWTPYGFPGIERAIVPVMTGLRRQQYQLEFFSEGTIPGQFIIPGDDISTPQQIRQLQDTLNALAGDQAWKHKIIVLPRGSDAKPQKPIELAGQIDDVLLNMICMAYDVMPMELGVGASKSSSQGAADSAAKASSDINKRKALKPMLQWLKTSIFDHILQDICRQDDMQFIWSGLENNEDEESMANNFKTLISTGILSIDEARSQMGLNPWGLPLTSDPVYMSATGVSTLGNIDPAAADAQLSGDALATNTTSPSGQGQAAVPAQVALPGQLPQGKDKAPPVLQGGQEAAAGATSTGTPGIGGRPKGGGGGAPAIVQPNSNSSTPLHGSGKKQKKAVSKAVQSEFDALRRFLKKGKPIAKWSPEFIPEDAFEVVKTLMSQGSNFNVAINKGKQVVRIADRVANRKESISEISDHVVTSLNLLANEINNPQVGMIGFIDYGVKVLQHGYHASLNAGARNAALTHSKVSAITPHDFKVLAYRRAQGQRDFLTGLAQDLKGSDLTKGAVTRAKLAQRLNLYARTLVPAYEQGFGLAVLSGQALGNSTLAEDNQDNATVDPTTVDDYSALDDMYNNDAVDTTDTTDATDMTDMTDGGDGMSSLLELAGMVGIGLLAGAIGADLMGDNGEMTADDGGDFETAPSSVIIWHTESDNPCDLCAERDGEMYTIDTLPCWPGDGGFGEFCEGAANCNCVLEYADPADVTAGDIADNPFSDVSVPFYAQRYAEENALDQAAVDARAEDIASVALDSPSAAADMATRDALYGVSYTRTGPGGRYDISAAAEPNLVKSDNPLIAVVWNYLKQHYKKSIIKWVKDADWSFEPKVSLDDVILARPESTISEKHVAEIKQDILNGKMIHPVILVKTDKGFVVADGNHRITALRELNEKTVAAYIATDTEKDGPWNSEMQDDSMKKFAGTEVVKSYDSQAAYKSIDLDVLKSLQVGDILTDDGTVIFSSVKPTSAAIAVVKYLPTGRILPGQELIVTEIVDNEVVLEIL